MNQARHEVYWAKMNELSVLNKMAIQAAHSGDLTCTLEYAQLNGLIPTLDNILGMLMPSNYDKNREEGYFVHNGVFSDLYELKVFYSRQSNNAHFTLKLKDKEAARIVKEELDPDGEPKYPEPDPNY